MNHFHQSGEEQLRVPNLLNSEGQQGLPDQSLVKAVRSFASP